MNNPETVNSWFEYVRSVEVKRRDTASERLKRIDEAYNEYQTALAANDSAKARKILNKLALDGQYAKTIETLAKENNTKARRDSENTDSMPVASLLALTGTALLSIAAFIFMAISWKSFGVYLQALIIITFNIISTLVTRYLNKKEILSSAEGLALLSILLPGITFIGLNSIKLIKIQNQNQLISLAALISFITAITFSIKLTPNLKTPAQLAPYLFLTFILSASLTVKSALEPLVFILTSILANSLKTKIEKSANSLELTSFILLLFGIFVSITYGYDKNISVIISLIIGLSIIWYNRQDITTHNLTEKINWQSALTLTALYFLNLPVLIYLASTTYKGIFLIPTFTILTILAYYISSHNKYLIASLILTPILSATTYLYLTNTQNIYFYTFAVMLIIMSIKLIRVYMLIVSNANLILQIALLSYTLNDLDISDYRNQTLTTTYLSVLYILYNTILKKVNINSDKTHLHKVNLAVTAALLLILFTQTPKNININLYQAVILAISVAIVLASLAFNRVFLLQKVIASLTLVSLIYYNILTYLLTTDLFNIPTAYKIEAYSLPLAALWLVAGLKILSKTKYDSIVALSPGLILLFAPLQYSSMLNSNLLKLLTTLVLSAFSIKIGLHLRNKAFIIHGSSAAIIASGIQVIDWAYGLPRWLSIAALGLILLIAALKIEFLKQKGNYTLNKLNELR